jgi:hypothetical protein
VVVSGVHQGSADPPTYRGADDRDHLALAVGNVVGKQPDGPAAAVGGDEAGKNGSVDQDALAGDGDSSEGYLQPANHPRSVAAFYGAHADHRILMLSEDQSQRRAWASIRPCATSTTMRTSHFINP